MNLINFIILFLWLIVIIRNIVFWVYLWQLKEYHGKRFFDHFRTEKGRKIFINSVFLAKAILFLFSFFVYQLVYPLIFIYVAQAIQIILKRNFLIPKRTLKSFLIIVFSLFLVLFLIILISRKPYFIQGILLVDLLLVILTTIPVLFFWPITIIFQRLLLNRAKKKIEQNKNLIVIGIVGSYGKTSTKEFLAHILSKKFKVFKTSENNNSEVGIAKTILNQLNDQQIFVAEIGAYDKGKVKQVCGFLKPKIGIVSGINEQHLSLFGSMKNLISGEGGKELIESLPENGIAILNANNPIIQNLRSEIKNYNPKLKNIKFCAVEKKEDFWAENIKTEKENISFTFFSKEGESADFKVNLIGTYNVENMLLAIACARMLEMNLKEISLACKSINKNQGILKKRFNKHHLNIIDSIYSTNPSAVMAHLEHLKCWKGKKAIVMPCLIELGAASGEVHKKIGKIINEICDLAIITTGERFKEIKEAAGKKALLIKNSKEIFDKLKEFSNEEDVILLEGRVPADLFNLLFQNE